MFVRFRKLSILSSSLFIFFFSGTRSVSNVDSVKDGWETRWQTRAEIERNDNVFRLSAAQESRMVRNDSGDVVSGRFRDMESVSDVTFSSALEVEASTKTGLFQRSLSLAGRIDFNHYFNNSKRDHVDLELSISQKISKRGKIKLHWNYVPSYFVKNFLADVTDSTGNVSRSERVYKDGVFSEWDIDVVYRHQFSKWIVDITGDLLVGYRRKSYQDPFTGRNEKTFRGGLAFELDLTPWWSVDLSYLFEPVKSPVTSEVLILSEFDYRIDFNNDRDFADNRAVLPVDRSHQAQLLEVASAFKLIKNITLHTGLGVVLKDYTSRQLIDPTHKDRNDTRTTIEFGFDYRIFSGFHLKGEYKRMTQKTNRREDSDYLGEITDYEMNIVRGGILMRFD